MPGPETLPAENPRIIIAGKKVFITDSKLASVELSEEEAADVLGALFDHFSIELQSRKSKGAA